jgi:hypothetical protein
MTRSRKGAPTDDPPVAGLGPRAARLVESRKQDKFVIYSLVEEVAATNLNSQGIKTLDLGCCQLDLVQPDMTVHGEPNG